MQPTTEAQAPSQLEGFDDFVASIMKDWQAPGLAIAIVREGRVVYSRGFGQRDVDRGLEVTPGTLFAIASCTKAFTTMAIAILADEGRLDWDTPVRSYLPGFRLYDPFATERMTVRDLVTHRSGLPRHDLMWYNSSDSRRNLVERLEHLEPNKDLRAVWQYQNLMYMTAGHLIEQLTGQSWEDFVQQRIFQPLEMHSSNFSVATSQAAADFARPYKLKDEQLEEMPFYTQAAVGPAGSINSNAADLAQWLLVNQQGGRYGDARLVSDGQLRDMHAPQMVIPPRSRYAELPHESYGLGWFVELYRGYNLIHHGGNIDGFSSMVTLMPGENLGVAVLTNLNGNPAPWIVCLNVYDRLLGLNQIAWSERFKKDEAESKEGEKRGKEKSESDRVAGTQPSHPLASYAGEYEHPGYGVMSVEMNDGELQAVYNSLTFPMKHYHYDTFELPFERFDVTLKATFATNARGNIESVSVPAEPTVRDVVFMRAPDRALREKSFLEQFAGEYELFEMSMTVALKGDDTLLARVPGQPDCELIPYKGAQFAVKDLSSFGFEFVVDESGAVSAAVVTQPGGVFTAKRR